MADAPFWSVMIPTFNSTEYLEDTLRGVLRQDPGVERMQIEIVDDCSAPEHDPGPLIGRIAPGRIKVTRQEKRQGLAGNWNACIERAQGRWIHILHADDLVYPGFYARLEEADTDPTIGAAFVRNETLDHDQNEKRLAPLQAEMPGPLGPEWIRTLALDQRIECCSIVVRKKTYEECGTFRKDLFYAIDWEMWMRIANRYRIWYDPAPLACYRVHPESETKRLARSGEIYLDDERCLRIFESTLTGDWVGATLRAARMKFAARALTAVEDSLWRRHIPIAVRNARAALRLDPRPATFLKLAGVALWGLQGALKVAGKRVTRRHSAR